MDKACGYPVHTFPPVPPLKSSGCIQAKPPKEKSQEKKEKKVEVMPMGVDSIKQEPLAWVSHRVCRVWVIRLELNLFYSCHRMDLMCN